MIYPKRKGYLTSISSAGIVEALLKDMKPGCYYTLQQLQSLIRKHRPQTGYDTLSGTITKLCRDGRLLRFFRDGDTFSPCSSNAPKSIKRYYCLSEMSFSSSSIKALRFSDKKMKDWTTVEIKDLVKTAKTFIQTRGLVRVFHELAEAYSEPALIHRDLVLKIFVALKNDPELEALMNNGTELVSYTMSSTNEKFPKYIRVRVSN